jgi:hypothetical protein
MPETTLLSQLSKINSLQVPEWRKNEYRGLEEELRSRIILINSVLI